MEKLTLEPRILGLLKRLLEKRALLTVTIAGQGKEYNSAIIKIAEDNSYFLLDELNPTDGHEQLKQIGQCHIKGHIDGVSLSFDTAVDHFGQDNGIPYYRILMPTAINYLQRRSAHRISFSAASPIVVTVINQNGVSFKGSLADLSTGGLRVKFANDMELPIASSDILRCQFKVDGHAFNAEVVVRIAKKSANGQPFIGAQFHNLVPALERQLQRLIMGLERAARQKVSG